MLRRQEDLSSPAVSVQGCGEQYEMLEQLLDALKGPTAHKEIWCQRRSGAGLYRAHLQSGVIHGAKVLRAACRVGQ